MKVVLNEKLNHLNDLKSIYSTLNKESNQQMPESISNKMENLLNKWNELEKNTDDNLINATPPPAQFETNELAVEQKEKTETELKKEKSENFEDYFNQIVANTKSDDTKLILTSEIVTSDLDEIKQSSSFIKDSSFSNVVNLIPTTTTSTPDTPPQDNVELISNDLFDWLLWIDHTLDSQVLKIKLKNFLNKLILFFFFHKAVTVGYLDEIQLLIQKYDVNLYGFSIFCL